LSACGDASASVQVSRILRRSLAAEPVRYAAKNISVPQPCFASWRYSRSCSSSPSSLGRGDRLRSIGSRRARAQSAALRGIGRCLAQLRQAGADLTKPTKINFYLYFKDRASADSAAVHAGDDPFVATVRRAGDDTSWLCFVSGQMVPSEAAIHAHAVRLLALATAHGGEYDGWEAAVVE
jgi:Protein of unknown function (DUF1260).